MIYFLIFYNSLNIDFERVYKFYSDLVDYVSKNNIILNNILSIKGIEFLGLYDIIKDTKSFNSIEKIPMPEDKIFLFTLGGDGTLFNSLSLIKKKFNLNFNIYVFPINFGNKGFYCFYDKNLINDIHQFLEVIINDYKSSNFLKGFFFKLVLKDKVEYFIGDVVIKSKIIHKPTKIKYYVDKCVNYLEELADGLLIFSKFGITGYFLSLYGIFIDLDIDDLIGVTFIAPHSVKYRPQILKNKEIYIENIDKNELIIIKDGQILNDSINYQEKIKIELDNSSFYLMGKTNIFDKWYKTFYI